MKTKKLKNGSMYKFVKTKERGYIYADVSPLLKGKTDVIEHKNMIKPEETPVAAGTFLINDNVIIITQRRSVSLNIGCT